VNAGIVLDYAQARLGAGPCITGIPGMVGDLVFEVCNALDNKTHKSKPWWIAEWQPDNGEVFACVDSEGNVWLAGPEELTRDWRGQVSDLNGEFPLEDEEEEYEDD